MRAPPPLRRSGSSARVQKLVARGAAIERKTGLDWTKLIDKFFGFLCALIPGSVVLLIAVLHRPDLWTTFWNIGHLEYQAKLAVLIGAAFVAGSTVNSVLGAIIGGISTNAATSQAEKRARGGEGAGRGEAGMDEGTASGPASWSAADADTGGAADRAGG